MDFFSPKTRAHFAPAAGSYNLSMDFNAAPSGKARGTEVIIPDNASPAVRVAAERYNQQVAAFAQKHGIADYPVRGVRTRSENGRGVPHTIHTEPFFNSDLAMQEAIKRNPAEFAAIYQSSFGSIPNVRAIAPHGVGKDRGAASSIFGDETTFGEFIANTALGSDYELPAATITAAGSDDTVLGGLSIQPSRAPDMLQTQEAPMQQEPARATGLLGKLFPDMTADRQDRIALALGGLSMHPNQSVMQMARQRIGDRREDAKEAKQTQAATAQATKTMQWLQSQAGTNPQAALALQMLGAGVIDPRSAVAMATQRGEDERTALMKNVEYIRAQNPDMSMQEAIQIAKSGTTVNVNNGDSEIGAIPQGFELVKDPETGARSMRPIPGGPADNTAKEAIADEGTRRSGDVVIEDIDRVLGKMTDGGLPVAGMAGGLLSKIPGTDAHDASRLLQTIRANVGFDRLQQMRDSSPTGGALGAINQSEMTLLNSALGSLEQSQSPEQFQQNLERLKGIYQEIVHGAGGTQPEAPQSVPNFQDMSDEELDAYIQKMEGR